MSEVKNLEQLRSKPLEEILKYQEQAKTRKAELESLKAKGGKAWTDELQDELMDVTMLLVDVEDIIEAKKSESVAYVAPKGSEDMVHLKVVKGRRFNPNTGIEESKPYNIMLTYSEWHHFKNNFSGLGYVILEVLHDKYNEAEPYVFKEKKQ